MPALIDTNVFWGSWPFALGPNLSVAQLAAHLARSGVNRALVSPLAAVLQPDPMPANLALFGAVRGRRTFVPVPILNPLLATWREQLERCHAEAGGRLRAVRLVPNYHNYSLRSRRLDDFLAALATMQARLILNVRLEDERQTYFALRIKGVPVGELGAFLKRFPRHHVLVAGGYRAELEALASSCENFSAEISFAEALHTVPALAKKIPARRLMFGSGAPLLSVAAQSAKLRHASLPAARARLVAEENARRFFAL